MNVAELYDAQSAQLRRRPLGQGHVPVGVASAHTLGLAAVCFLDEDGYDLRSRCLLDGKPGTMQFVGRGATKDFELDAGLLFR
jgi:hypothetical protein